MDEETKAATRAKNRDADASRRAKMDEETKAADKAKHRDAEANRRQQKTPPGDFTMFPGETERRPLAGLA